MTAQRSQRTIVSARGSGFFEKTWTHLENLSTVKTKVLTSWREELDCEIHFFSLFSSTATKWFKKKEFNWTYLHFLLNIRRDFIQISSDTAVSNTYNSMKRGPLETMNGTLHVSRRNIFTGIYISAQNLNCNGFRAIPSPMLSETARRGIFLRTDHLDYTKIISEK